MLKMVVSTLRTKRRWYCSVCRSHCTEFENQMGESESGHTL